MELWTGHDNEYDPRSIRITQDSIIYSQTAHLIFTYKLVNSTQIVDKKSSQNKGYWKGGEIWLISDTLYDVHNKQEKKQALKEIIENKNTFNADLIDYQNQLASLDPTAADYAKNKTELEDYILELRDGIKASDWFYKMLEAGHTTLCFVDIYKRKP